MRTYSGPHTQYGAVRHESFLHDDGWSYVTAHLPLAAAASATAGVSAPVNTTSAPAAYSESAASRSFCGSCQVLMNRTSIVHSGQVTLTPRVMAFPRRSSSGIGKVAMYPSLGLPSFLARDPASIPARYFMSSTAPKKLPKFFPFDL